MTINHRDSTPQLRRRTLLRSIGVGVSGVVGAQVTTKARAESGSYTRHTHGGLAYTKYVPASVDGSTAVPLLVMLHGCTQTADDFKTGTRMNEVADENGFIAIYPEQSTSRHFNRCWQWFNDQNTTRGNGEVATIAGMVETVKAAHTIDETAVYAAGLSAGGAMVPNLVVEYADVFSGAGVHSGLEYDAVENQTSGVLAMSQCSAKDPQQAGTKAYNRMEEFDVTSELPTIVFHGANDTTVYPCNGEQATEQAIQTNDLSDTGSDDDSIDHTADRTYSDCSNPNCVEVSEYHDADGQSVVEHWVVSEMGHAWSGGDGAGSYTDPDGPDASREMWAFFSTNTPDPGDNNPPVAAATADPTVAMVDESIDFDGSGSSDSDGSISSYEWAFDDGTTVSGVTVSHSYDTTGTMIVELTVTDNAGATSSDTVAVEITESDFDGYCGIADNYTHVQAGRAWTDGSYAYAEGSDENMGLYNTFETTRLKETADGYFEIVSTCE